MYPIHIEACVEAASAAAVRRSVASAYHGGADTVELCAGMVHGGLTPSPAHVRVARAAFARRPGLMVMIRPRPGDFRYDAAEVATMADDIRRAADAGADGVVLGPLTDRGLDHRALERLTALADTHRLRVTFHRAFDALADPHRALETLIDLGVARVLTSGTPWGSAAGIEAGLPRLGALIRQAGARIELVLGGGIHPGNVARVLSALPAGRLAVHAYSGLLLGGVTDRARVAALVRNASGAKDRMHG